MYCANCGSEFPDSNNFCPNCGSAASSADAAPASAADVTPASIAAASDAAASAAAASSTTTQPVYAQATYEQPGYAQAATNLDAATAPIDGWKTSVGMSIAGFLVSSFISSGISQLNRNGDIVALAYVYSAVIFIASLVWALKIYPDFFKNRNLGTMSAGVVSFVNLFLGGIIFGCLWNYNMTRGVKGISNIVFVVIKFLALILLVFAVGTAISLLIAAAV